LLAPLLYANKALRPMHANGEDFGDYSQKALFL
jgi:hypothetical protein